MIYRSSQEVCESFFQYFAKRNVEMCLDCVTEDIIYIDTACTQQAFSKEKLRRVLARDLFAVEEDYRLELTQNASSLFENTVTAHYNCTLYNRSLDNERKYGISISTRATQECGYKISMFHASPSGYSTDDENFCAVNIDKDMWARLKSKVLPVTLATDMIGVFPEEFALPFVFANQRLAHYLGYENTEELLRAANHLFLHLVHPEDRDFVQKEYSIRLDYGTEHSIEFRLVHKDGSTRWVRAAMTPYVDQEERAISLSLLLDISLLKAAEEEKAQMMNRIPHGIAVFLVSDAEAVDEVYYVNDALASLFGYEHDEFIPVLQKGLSFLVKDTHRAQLHENIAKTMELGVPFHCTLPYNHKTGATIFVDVQSNFFPHENGVLCYTAYTDVTALMQTEENLQDTNAQRDAIIDNLHGGLVVFNVNDDDIFSIDSFSHGMENVLRDSYENILSFIGTDALEGVHPDDAERVRTAIMECLRTSVFPNTSYRLANTLGVYHWVYVTGKIIDTPHGARKFLLIYTNIDDIEAQKEELRLQREKFSIALKKLNMTVWEYDIVGHRMIQHEHEALGYATPHITDNFPNSFFENSQFPMHPASLKEYARMHQEVRDGAEHALARVRVKNSDGQWQTLDLQYHTLFDGNHKPVSAIGFANDVTEQLVAEERYAEELALREVSLQDSLASVRINLTQGSIEKAVVRHEAFAYLRNENFAECCRKFEENSFVKGMSSEAFFDNLIDAFASGERRQRYEYRRVIQGKRHWMGAEITLLKNPKDNCIIAILNVKDIDKTKIFELMSRKAINSTFDFIGCIDVVEKSYLLTQQTEELYPAPIASEREYNKIVSFIAENHAVDAHQYVAELSLEAVVSALKESDGYSVYSAIYDAHKKVLQKKYHFAWLDKEEQLIMLTGTDVTDATETEKRKNTLLNEALSAAQQASVAKTEFLSRMSHEIRTPLNAIIGLTALAAQEEGLSASLSDSLGKIGISSRFLLSLINDILDMSRIESMRMKLKKERICFDSFFEEINTIIYAQAHANDIDYEVSINGFTQEVYLGDATKLQQVFLNILFNAIKFTPKGGKIQFQVRELECTNNYATLQFIISDTGIGISEEFLPNIFDAFSQEEGGNTAQYSGTGLGLPICQKLVGLMNGNITVRSIKGKGSEFTVTVRLDLPEEAARTAKLLSSKHFEKLSTLVVDDDVIVCQHTQKILQQMGMCADWVDSGAAAIVRVREQLAKDKSFNIIIVDFKMPFMDGIETTRELRKLVGPDVTIVIMTAYDFSGIEEEAREAGVDAFMHKPLCGSSISRVFSEVLGEKQGTNKPDAAVRQKDLQGKRVLLVEDHPINVEVAKRTLEKRGVLVDVAFNGLEALERFAATPEGYFDAILMDIRMPVMDGLTAAENIRRMRKADSKDIPIIAMTANAFQEDAEKSQKSGMNAHLAKPIEPAILFATLERLLVKKA